MVTDIYLNDGMDVEMDGGGDLRTVSGHQQLEQSLAIDVLDEVVAALGGRITGQTVGSLEERFRQALNDDPQVGTIAYVNITEFNRQRGTISAEVGVTEDENFNIEVSAPEVDS